MKLRDYVEADWGFYVGLFHYGDHPYDSRVFDGIDSRVFDGWDGDLGVDVDPVLEEQSVLVKKDDWSMEVLSSPLWRTEEIERGTRIDSWFLSTDNRGVIAIGPLRQTFDLGNLDSIYITDIEVKLT